MVSQSPYYPDSLYKEILHYYKTIDDAKNDDISRVYLNGRTNPPAVKYAESTDHSV